MLPGKLTILHVSQHSIVYVVRSHHKDLSRGSDALQCERKTETELRTARGQLYEISRLPFSRSIQY